MRNLHQLPRRRGRVLLVGASLAAALAVPPVASAAAIATQSVAAADGAVAPDQFCTKGDVQALVNSLELGGIAPALGDAFARCQFRIFDENDDPNDPFGNPDNPEVPHVFTDQDYVLAGIALFIGYEFFYRPEFDRGAAIDSLNTATDRFFFGTAATPDADLEEIALTQTNYRDLVMEFGHIVSAHKYHIFTPGSLAPGEYKFRWEETFPDGDFVARGVVVILDA